MPAPHDDEDRRHHEAARSDERRCEDAERTEDQREGAGRDEHGRRVAPSSAERDGALET